jgi:purine-binding chemotaxis protein CheW
MSAQAVQQTTHAKSERSPKPPRCCFTIFVAGEMFGLPVDSVQTIFRIEEITPVPLGPPEIEGLVNLRGRIVTAVSLKRRVFKAPRESSRGALAIGIEHDGENFALIVDEVGDVITCEESGRVAGPPHIDANRARLTNDYYQLEGRILPILSLDSLFDFAERNRGTTAAQVHAKIIRSDP